MRPHTPIPPLLRIGQAAKMVGLCNKTLKRAEGEGILTFIRGNGEVRWVKREVLLHAPLLSQRRAAKMLGIRCRKLGNILVEIEASFRVPLSCKEMPRFKYFSLAAVKALDREEFPPKGLRITYAPDDSHWERGRLISYFEKHLHAYYDVVNSNG